LYRFRTLIPGGNVIATNYYTSGGVPYSSILNGETWDPQPISNTEWDRALDIETFDIVMPASIAPASDFVSENPATVVWMDIYNTAGEIQCQGRVISVDFSKVRKKEAVLKVASMGSVLDADVPSRRFNPSCPFDLGDSNCGVTLSGYEKAVLRSSCSVSGRTISYTDAAGEASGYYSMGYVTQGDCRQYIMKHTKVGNTMTMYLLAAFAVIDGSDDSFHFYPGCDKILATCGSKFNKEESFGGFTHVPYSNPVVNSFPDVV